MTDKEFKRLSRPQLIEIIYQLQLKQDELERENENLSADLADKRLRIEKAGNLAEAVLEIYGVMNAAKEAAAHYAEELQQKTNDERRKVLEEAQKEAAAIIAQAQQEAQALLAQAKKEVFGWQDAGENE